MIYLIDTMPIWECYSDNYYYTLRLRIIWGVHFLQLFILIEQGHIIEHKQSDGKSGDGGLFCRQGRQ